MFEAALNIHIFFSEASRKNSLCPVRPFLNALNNIYTFNESISKCLALLKTSSARVRKKEMEIKKIRSFVDNINNAPNKRETYSASWANDIEMHRIFWPVLPWLFISLHSLFPVAPVTLFFVWFIFKLEVFTICCRGDRIQSAFLINYEVNKRFRCVSIPVNIGAVTRLHPAFFVCLQSSCYSGALQSRQLDFILAIQTLNHWKYAKFVATVYILAIMQSVSTTLCIEMWLHQWCCMFFDAYAQTHTHTQIVISWYYFSHLCIFRYIRIFCTDTALAVMDFNSKSDFWYAYLDIFTIFRNNYL